MTFVPPMAQTCSIYTVTRNRYSDRIQGAAVTEVCHFRYITDVNRGTNSELTSSDAMVWLTASTTAALGSIVGYDGMTYQIEKLTRAKRLYDDVVQFVKCDLKILVQAVS